MLISKVSGKFKTAEAIRYALTRREALEHFLTDGRIEIESNIVERAIRPQTITRKNSLFAGSEGGGETWATIATLLQTALCRARHKQVSISDAMVAQCSAPASDPANSAFLRLRVSVSSK